MSVNFSRLDQSSAAIRRAIQAADEMFAVRQDTDDIQLRLLRDRLEPLAENAANRTIAEDRLLQILADIANEWRKLEGHVDEGPSGSQEFGRRNAVFNLILEARDPLKLE